MTIEIFSWLVMLIGIFGTWTTGKHNIGWLIAVLFQILWIYYALAIGAEALAAQSAIFGVIAARNYWVGRVRPDID